MNILSASNAAALLLFMVFSANCGKSSFIPFLDDYTPPKIELHPLKLSEHNDTDYVRQIMQKAKAAEMQNYMQTEVQPCDDFYAYSCGNWAKINPTNSFETIETNFYQLLTNSYNNKLLRFLKSDEQHSAQHNSSEQVENKARRFYASCFGIQSKQQLYKTKLQALIAEFGEMPALLQNRNGTWNETDFDWLSLIARVQARYGVDIILQIGIREDFEDKTHNKLFLGQAALKLQTKAMYFGEATKFFRERYRKNIQDQLENFFELQSSVALNVSHDVLNFETLLAKGINDIKSGKPFKSLNKLRTVSEMQSIYGEHIDFEKYLNITLGYKFNDTFYEFAELFQQNLVQVIQSAPKSQVANYIFYQFVSQFFIKYNLPAHDRKEVCLQKTKIFFAKVLDNCIFRELYDNNAENDVHVIWLKIKEAFKQLLLSNELSWMSSDNRQLALDKLQHMKLEINSYQNSNVSQEYHNVSINSHDYVENVRQLSIYQTQEIINSLHESPKPSEHPLVLSYTAAFVATENLIKIPVSLLQPNYLWSHYYPHSIKFGTLGYLVAHELIHGFDDLGRNYDFMGHEKDWWDATTTNEFDKLKVCFKNQYARFRYGGKYLPESELQSENIADNGGIRLAYKAYERFMAELNSNSSSGAAPANHTENLPSLPLSNKQLFFLSFAQFWCNDINERYKDSVSLIDSHAPAKFRVIGSLANFEEFAKEFKCAVGTTMNPEKRCKIY